MFQLILIFSQGLGGPALLPLGHFITRTQCENVGARWDHYYPGNARHVCLNLGTADQDVTP